MVAHHEVISISGSMYAFFLGSNRELSQAELAAIRHTNPNHLPSIDHMGGTSRIAKIMKTFQNTPSAQEILDALPHVPEKWMVGVGLVGNSKLNIKKCAQELKLAAREKGSKLKFVIPAGKAPILNAAQVIFNKLTENPNAEFLLIESQQGVHLAQTMQIQDIQAYEIRDTSRPARDPKVGMLPPKLAQIMINIAVAATPAGEEQYSILDPFCGMGTILQEGWLMGHRMVGSDVSSRMVGASHENLDWLAKHFSVQEPAPEIIEQDARQEFPPRYAGTFDAIVTEPYLGKPLSTPLPTKEIAVAHEHVGALYKKAFENFASLLKPGGVVLFALPAYRTSSGFTRFPASFLDEIRKLGYIQEQLLPEHKTILYSRKDALVGRELTLWKKT